MLKTILIIILMINYFAYSLKSNDICIKKVECNGNNCGLSNCKGQLSYECSRLECARNEQLCEEYHEVIRYLDLRKNIKLDKLKTLATIRGISFVTKNLRKFENLKNQIEECSFFD
jgi:hypothetical protein